MGHIERSESIADGLNESVIACEGITDATIIATAIDAHRHAVLALVEQQRIGNLIAMFALSDDDANDFAALGINFLEIAASIREGLGI